MSDKITKELEGLSFLKAENIKLKTENAALKRYIEKIKSLFKCRGCAEPVSEVNELGYCKECQAEQEKELSK